MFGAVRQLTGHDLPGLLAADAAALGLHGASADTTVVGEADLQDLPEPARRYLRFMGVVGRPRDGSFRAQFTGRFRMRPGQKFVPFDAWQYNTRTPVARLFHMRIDFAGILPVIGRDAYVDGHGRMRGKILGIVPVADGTGDEFDLSELVTWLNDAIMLCPSMLLDDATTWSGVDADTFAVTFTDSGITVTARVTVDDRGAPLDFSTTDRYAALPGGLVRAEWTTPITQWNRTGGRPAPGPGAAIWHLPEGPFTYIEGTFGAVDYNVELGGPSADLTASGPREAAEVVAALPVMLSSPFRRRSHLRWGATDAEVEAAMPGDELVPVSHFTATRAVTIAAPPNDVWPWLMQVGVGRAGFYSYDLLDNLGRSSATEPLPQWQTLHVGDLVAPMKDPPTPNTSFVVESMVPNRSVVWSKRDSTWTWTLAPLTGNRTRLVTRIKQRYRPNLATVVTVVLCEFGDFTMMRKMLLGIKQRAEKPASIDLTGASTGEEAQSTR